MKTFGTLAFQTDPDGGGAPAGGDPTYESIAAGAGAPPAATPAAADPAATPAAPPAGEPTPAEWVGPSREEWEQTQGFLNTAAPFLSELQELLAEDQNQPGYTGQQAPAQVDLSTPEGIQSYLDTKVDELYQSRFGAYEPVLGQIAEREGEQMARSTLDQLATEGGEFNRDLALVAAQLYVDPARGAMAPADALRAAADYARGIEAGIKEQAIKEYQASLGNAATASGDPGISGAATTAPSVATGRDRYEQTLASFVASQNPTQPV